LRVHQQRDGLRIGHVGSNEELDVIAESMDLLWGQTSALRRTPGLEFQTAPLSPDAAYIELVLPTPGDKGSEGSLTVMMCCPRHRWHES
jgi:hypothetical protein